MKYQTLLDASSPRLAALEARLGRVGQKPERPRRLVAQLHSGGKRHGRVIPLSPAELENWFWKMVLKNESNGCWEWFGKTTGAGYGRFRNGGKFWYCHRYVASLFCGADTELQALHKCDNRRCVNPSHIFLGTNSDNYSDMRIKGRHRPFGAKAIIGWEKADAVKRMLADGVRGSVICRMLGLTKVVVSQIKHRKTWVLP